MSEELERDLGLQSVIAISMGAMIGSGIFILPGLAMAEAGPAVILAFVLAAILVVPAAISIAELGPQCRKPAATTFSSNVGWVRPPALSLDSEPG